MLFCVSELDNNGSIERFYLTDIEVDKESVSQYTGLKDKNGGMIFEGDILRCGDDSFTGLVCFNSNKCAFYIKFFHNNERSKENRSIPLPEFIKKRELAMDGKCKIIRSIHEAKNEMQTITS